MKYKVKPTKKFEKDLKLAAKRGYDLNLIANIIKRMVKNYRLKIKIIFYLVTISIRENVI